MSVMEARSAAVGGATRIAPRLWMGAHPPSGPAVAQAGFTDLFLCAFEKNGHYPGVLTRHVLLDDSGAPISADEKRWAFSAGIEVSRLLGQGRRVLVTCSQGRNRSGLVVAIALLRLGSTPEEAIDHVKRLRNRVLPFNRPALANEQFTAFIRSLRPAETSATMAG